MLPVAVSAKPRRTRYAHGIALPRVADGRTQAAKRFRSLVTQFARELGGADLSAADQAIIKQAAHLVLASEQLQTASVSGERVDADTLVRVNSEARRVLGMLRKSKANNQESPDVPTSFLSEKYGDEEAEPEAGGYVTMLLRSIAETANGAEALTVPVIQAVSGCMHQAWTDKEIVAGGAAVFTHAGHTTSPFFMHPASWLHARASSNPRQAATMRLRRAGSWLSPPPASIPQLREGTYLKSSFSGPGGRHEAVSRASSANEARRSLRDADCLKLRRFCMRSSITGSSTGGARLHLDDCSASGTSDSMGQKAVPIRTRACS
jgi:hypothetical protein